MQRKVIASLLAFLLPATAGAADNVFQLGTVEVVGSQAGEESSDETVVDAAALAEYNRDTVGSAVALVPGMSLAHNSRNEDIVYLRGFDVREVPLFVDGVPVYVPYDGYVDFGRFTTFDLAEVRVAKGAASLLYGPNTLGGAINLVTRKPSKALEGDVRAGVFSGEGRRAAVNLGSNQGSWYLQLGASHLEADTFPLSGDFKATAVEDGGDRENAYRKDTKLSFKVGLTPNASDEYAFGYVRQDGEKGNPPYAGTAPGSIRYWQWPYWDKESVYFVSNTALGDKHILKARVYNDHYRNSLIGFTNGTYTTQLNNTSFPSAYNDTTRGVSLELASYLFEGHELRVAGHYKQDMHEETNPNSPTKDFRDDTVSLAVEDAIALAPGWRLRLGASRDQRETDKAYTYEQSDVGASNWLAALSHDLAGATEVYGSLARKSRFPTIKDRYSYRLGTAIPNPDLRPETALNLEIGIKTTPWSGARAEAAVFRSRIEDLMQTVVVTSTECGGSTCNQMQNIAEARHQGFELAIEQRLAEAWRLGLNYTWLDRRNESSSTVPLTDTPRQRVFGHVDWDITAAWALQATAEWEEGRKVAYGSTGTYRTLSSYTVLGVKGIWRPVKDAEVEVGVSNLTDENYELSDGYPMPGRMLFANASYRF
ncbi:TonB-dependent receptor [Parasulfuritortus cantonensis]|uniref:TonB-dependent receptor n=1 Tax=Parasulfuritortus cantonensis TaxID=2528202 RepID=A0A4V2NV09_9PROT|nr:TonB-dependent receptor [Parasulfuritortus cantonensis]TCJ11656.1 TonB-dependent receptor [Parasulfuritortus cantonensis]